MVDGHDLRKTIGRNAEAYINDIPIRLSEKRNHLTDLGETFDNIRKAGIRLKAKKCMFGFTEGKFWGSE